MNPGFTIGLEASAVEGHCCAIAYNVTIHAVGLDCALG
jgi:hypothetical protein